MVPDSAFLYVRGCVVPLANELAHFDFVFVSEHFPAAPFFLFMHGKDITIPKGTEITAYISGDTRLEQAKFQQGGKTGAQNSAINAALAQLDVASVPTGADIEVDGKFVGSTPSSITLPAGDHEIAIKKNGFAAWNRKMSVSAGRINVNAELIADTK